MGTRNSVIQVSIYFERLARGKHAFCGNPRMCFECESVRLDQGLLPGELCGLIHADRVDQNCAQIAIILKKAGKSQSPFRGDRVDGGALTICLVATPFVPSAKLD